LENGLISELTLLVVNLHDPNKPVGVAGYQLTQEVPEQLKTALPDAEQLKEKIQFELGLNREDL
jgi:hypothetical protein